MSLESSPDRHSFPPPRRHTLPDPWNGRWTLERVLHQLGLLAILAAGWAVTFHEVTGMLGSVLAPWA